MVRVDCFRMMERLRTREKRLSVRLDKIAALRGT